MEIFLQELELESEPKFWIKGEPEPKINIFGSATLNYTVLHAVGALCVQNAIFFLSFLL